MANEKNLRPCKTKKEARERGSKGGKASGVAKRRKKSMQELAKALLSFAPRNKADRTMLEAAGFDSADSNNGALIVHAMLQEAVGGDVQAAKFIAELLGDGAMHELKKQELALKKKALKAAEKQGVETSSAMLQLVNSLKAAE